MDPDPDLDSDSAPEVRHPRTLVAFRIGLYACAAVAAVALLGVGLSVLGVSVTIALLSLLLTGEANALGLAVLAGVGVVTTGGLAVGVGVAARRIDRRVTAADQRPDPLDDLHRLYVDGDIDETTLERRLERHLTGAADGHGRDTGSRRRVLGVAYSRRVLGVVRRRLRPSRSRRSRSGDERDPDVERA